MAAVVKSTKAGYDAISASKCINISELLTAGAGLAFEKFSPVFIDSDGKVRPATDDSTNELAFDGFAMSANDSVGGLPCTILGQGLIMEWLEDSDNITPGTRFYVGATNQLETTGTTPIVMAINNKEIIVIAPPGLRAAVA
jgi:hypothetical protein